MSVKCMCLNMCIVAFMIVYIYKGGYIAKKQCQKFGGLFRMHYLCTLLK